MGLSWLLIQTVTWRADFRQVGACGVWSYPGLRHGEEIGVLSETNFTMASYWLFIDLMFAWVIFRHLGGPGFGLISPARRSRMKRQEGDRAGGINIENLMLKCKQKVLEGGLKGQKLTTSGH